VVNGLCSRPSAIGMLRGRACGGRRETGRELEPAVEISCKWRLTRSWSRTLAMPKWGQRPSLAGSMVQKAI